MNKWQGIVCKVCNGLIFGFSDFLDFWISDFRILDSGWTSRGAKLTAAAETGTGTAVQHDHLHLTPSPSPSTHLDSTRLNLPTKPRVLLLLHCCRPFSPTYPAECWPIKPRICRPGLPTIQCSLLAFGRSLSRGVGQSEGGRRKRAGSSLFP